MDQECINVNYKYSKYKGDYSENTLEVHVHYRISETLLEQNITSNKYRAKLLKLLTQHIAAYEALNNHIASSVVIISINLKARRGMDNPKFSKIYCAKCESDKISLSEMKCLNCGSPFADDDIHVLLNEANQEHLKESEGK